MLTTFIFFKEKSDRVPLGTAQTVRFFAVSKCNNACVKVCGAMNEMYIAELSLSHVA